MMAFSLDDSRADIHLISSKLINVFPEPVFRAAIMFSGISRSIKRKQGRRKKTGLKNLSELLGRPPLGNDGG
jgi:hypothetical protein